MENNLAEGSVTIAKEKNLVWQKTDISKEVREKSLNQKADHKSVSLLQNLPLHLLQNISGQKDRP